MTPSSPSEPELETQPAKTSPPGTPAPTSSDAPIDTTTDTTVASPAVAESSNETAADAVTVAVPVTESAPATPDEPATGNAPAEAPATVEAPVTTAAKPARKRTPPKAKPVAAATPADTGSPVETASVAEPKSVTEPASATESKSVTEPASATESKSVTEPASATESAPTTAVPEADAKPESTVAATPVFTDPSVTEAPAAETTPVAKDETVGTGETPVEVVDDEVEITPMTDAEAREYEALNHDHEDVDHDEVLASDPPVGYPTLVPLVGALVGLVAVAALLIVSFALPAVHSGPNKLPIGVAGSADITGQLEQLFTTGDSNAFKVRTFTKEADLRSAIADNELYGGLSVNETAITMLVSSGASTTAADALSGVANSLSAQAGQQIPVTDVVPLPKDDVQGKGLAAINVPLVAAAIFPALIVVLLYRRRTAAQIGVAAAASVLVGLALSAVLSYVIGTTGDSNFLLVSVGLAGGVLATSLLLLGLFAVGGRIAFGLGAAVLLLLGAPLSGLATAPEWTSKPWGQIGQLLPPGANASLLRTTAYFDGHGFATDTLVLLAWGLVGLLLIGLGTLIAKPATANESAPATRPVGANELVEA